MINIRKLAALDMLLHGGRLIQAEFGIGILVPIVLGIRLLGAGWSSAVKSGWDVGLGLWLIGMAANYVPLFIYTILIARAGTIQEEGQPELPQVKRYSIQQVIIFVPFLVAVLAVMQERRRTK